MANEPFVPDPNTASSMGWLQSQGLPFTSQPTGGVGPNLNPNLQDMAQLAAQQIQQIQQTPADVEATKTRAEIANLLQQKAAMPAPGTPGGPRIGLSEAPWMQMQPVTGPVSLAKDVGRGALGLLSATRPGMAWQESAYAPGIRSYEAQQQSLASRIAGLQTNEMEAQKQLGTYGQVAGRTIMGAGRPEAAAINAKVGQQRVEVLRTQIANELQVALKKIETSKEIADKVTARDEAVATIAGKYRVEAADVSGQYGVERSDIMSQLQQTLLNTKEAQDPSVMGSIKRWFGVEPAQAPGGAQPVAGQAPLPPRAGGGKGGGKTVTFHEGTKIYTIPADQVAEFKKDHPHAR